METNQQIQHLSKPIGYSEATGLDVYKSFIAASGFNYIMGTRGLGDIIIMEQVAEGTASTLLCGILIYHKTGNVLLSEIQVPRFTPYTRTKVVEIVKESLLNLLINSASKNGHHLDAEFAAEQIEDMLDTCYFERSRTAIIDWATSIGIIKN